MSMGIETLYRSPASYARDPEMLNHRFKARLFNSIAKSCELNADEIKAEDVIGERFCDKRFAGKVGFSIDPFKAAEEILAKHYGDARTVEANYSWKPNRIVR